MSKKRIAFYNIGCRTNIAEIEEWIFDLNPDFYEVSTENPDYVIINTCSVTSKAAGKSRAKINKIIRDFPNAKIVVAGCSVDNNDIAVEDNITYVKNRDKEILLEVLEIEKRSGVSDLEFRTRQNVIIQTGCNSRCSYCIIPYLRGAESSRDISKIVNHVKELFESGIKEIVLTGTNIGRYKYQELGLYELLENLLLITPDNCRVRLSSIEPWDFDDRIIDLVKNNAKICPFFHIPLQSGNKRILKGMNRNYSLEDFENLVKNIKKAIPTAMVGTDVIVGFPDETDEEYDETAEFLRNIPIDHFHVFSYSPRRGTVLEKTTSNNVTNEVKKHRVTSLLQVGKDKKKEFLNSLIGTELEIIVEKQVDQTYVGKAENFVDVVIINSKDKLTKGSLQSVAVKSLYKDISLQVELTSS